MLTPRVYTSEGLVWGIGGQALIPWTFQQNDSPGPDPGSAKDCSPVVLQQKAMPCKQGFPHLNLGNWSVQTRFAGP